MCVEHVTLWLGEMVHTDVVLRCGHTRIDLERCVKSRSFFYRLSKNFRDGRCRDTQQVTKEVGTLCPKCLARGDDDPFYLYHMSFEPEHIVGTLPSPPESPRPRTYTNTAAAAATTTTTSMPNPCTVTTATAVPTAPMTSQRMPTLAVARPSTAHQRFPRQQDTSLEDDPPRALPGLRRSHAVRRPPSRANRPARSGLQYSSGTDHSTGSSSSRFG